MTVAQELASFVARASFSSLSRRKATDALRLRILDALGCAFGALDAGPIAAIRESIDELGGRPVCTLIGGGRTAPDRATFFNGALVRYLDFNDSYLARAETCHPSDNFSAVLAAAEHTAASGRTLMTALAVAYQVQCRFSDAAPVRSRGFDHTTHGAIAAAAGVSHALGLDVRRTEKCRVRVVLEDGRVLVREKRDYLGYLTRPMSWQAVQSKFETLSARHLSRAEQAGIASAVSQLEDLPTTDLCARLALEDPRRAGQSAATPEASHE